jgi:hypothetical protein
MYRMLRAGLDHGESEAMVLYSEGAVELLLLDDGEARRMAATLGMTIMGTGGVLLLAKRKGLISSVVENLNVLETRGAFRLSSAVRLRLAKEAGE